MKLSGWNLLALVCAATFGTIANAATLDLDPWDLGHVLRLYNYGGGTSRDSVSISCPVRSEVKTWYDKIKDTPESTDEDPSQSHSLIMIQAGDSNPPFP